METHPTEHCQNSEISNHPAFHNVHEPSPTRVAYGANRGKEMEEGVDSHQRTNLPLPSQEQGMAGSPENLRSASGGLGSTINEQFNQSQARPSYYRRYRVVLHLIIWLFFTAWWVAGLTLHAKDPLSSDTSWLKSSLLWLGITLRLIFCYIPLSIMTKFLQSAWDSSAVRLVAVVPERLRNLLGAFLVLTIIVIGSFITPESADNTRINRVVSLFGLIVILFALWATSRDRKKIVWKTVIIGMLLQYLIALFVLRSSVGYNIFSFVSELARDLLGFADQGTIFLTTETIPKLGWFIITVLPAIIFFVGLIQLLSYYRILQWLVSKVAAFFFWSLQVSGAEAVVAAASPFLGIGESAALIRPFIADLTSAEIHQIMCSGFATIAGSVLLAYISIGVNAQALISSCVMSIPASLAISKLRYPESDEPITKGHIVISYHEKDGAINGLHAFTGGAWLGLKIAGMIFSTLLCIISLLALINGLLIWWGRYLDITDPPMTIELIVGYLCYPVAFLLGVPRNGDLLKVAQLVGTKLVTNEFVAYTAMQTDPSYANLSSRSRLIATYALCGFANIGALSIQIGVLSQLAPNRSGDISRLAVSALISGALSTFTSASIAGLLIQNESAHFAPNVTASG